MGRKIIVQATAMLAACMWLSPAIAQAPEPKTLLQTYSDCLDLQSALLDDGLSDAGTIALAIEEACASTYEDFLRANNGGNLDTATEKLANEYGGARHNFAIVHVLKMRRAAQELARKR